MKRKKYEPGDEKPQSVPCEVCNTSVSFEEVEESEKGDIIIEYSSYFPPYSEFYAFCHEHRPSSDEMEIVKQRIRDGVDPIQPDGS